MLAQTQTVKENMAVQQSTKNQTRSTHRPRPRRARHIVGRPRGTVSGARCRNVEMSEDDFWRQKRNEPGGVN